jgi:hypothetical protein
MKNLIRPRCRFARPERLGSMAQPGRSGTTSTIIGTRSGMSEKPGLLCCRSRQDDSPELQREWRRRLQVLKLRECVQAGRAEVRPRSVSRLPTHAARNRVRTGVPVPVAIKITGHGTDSMFRRYAMVDELRETGSPGQDLGLLASSRRAQSGRHARCKIRPQFAHSTKGSPD